MLANDLIIQSFGSSKFIVVYSVNGVQNAMCLCLGIDLWHLLVLEM